VIRPNVVAMNDAACPQQQLRDTFVTANTRRAIYTSTAEAHVAG
jgi:hypothetical protein